MQDRPDATAAGQLLVDIVEIRRHTGTRRPYETTAHFDDLRAGDFSVVDGNVQIDFVIEAVTEGVVAKGTVSGEWTGPCRRCLDPMVRPLEVEVHEVFERHPTEGETWPIEDERIDVAPMIRESALLALPLVPLCRDDCEGPEPERFPATVEPDVDLAAESAPDPRWAALDELRFDD